MTNSRFYEMALERIHRETQHLTSFCEELDKNPTEKKKRIIEYKRAKYRYAGATKVWCMFFHSHRVAEKNAETHYLIPQVNDIFITVPEYVACYNIAPEAEKRDYALYYGVIALADVEVAKHEAKLEGATDWERVELEERIGGLKYAKACLDDAWQRRKEVSE